ncbi:MULTISPECIES: S-layer homology domain-containing protein [unclassified Streptomyces]
MTAHGVIRRTPGGTFRPRRAVSRDALSAAAAERA